MNILTFDIEEWFEEYEHFGRNGNFKPLDNTLNDLLDKLDALQIKGTFFCVGKMAELFPEVIRLIDSRNHEIGCHSHNHRLLTQKTRQEVLQDTQIAIDSLEQCTGKKVISYRAPAFSINKEIKWAFNVLAECGIERDASIYPALRDFGGFENFGSKEPAIIECDGVTIKEFPICLTNIFGKEMAYSGGGYLRVLPLWFVNKELNKNNYGMVYCHIRDLMVEITPMYSKAEFEERFNEPGTIIARYKRFIKRNIAQKGTMDKLFKLLIKNEFVNLETADNMIDWDKQKTIVL